MQKVLDTQIRKWQQSSHFTAQLPVTVIATCPYCVTQYIPLIVSWELSKKSDNSRVHQTHITGNSVCGVCSKSIFFLLITPQQQDHIDVPGGVYMLPDPPVGKTFSEEIRTLSPSFANVYQQAAQAEVLELTEVAGPGYRKALEFLVKDYLISIETEGQSAKDEIAVRGLHRCITSIGSEKLKAAAEAAKLIGNDESHYISIQNQTIEDLKRFIDITVHWLEFELETQALIQQNN